MFGTKSPKAVKLADKAREILDVFTSTKNDLIQLNNDIANEQDDLQAKIADLQLQHNSLTDVKSQNEKVIGNINKILE